MKKIIDVACGSKMFWFDKHNPNVEFCDKRSVPKFEYYSKRYIEISPDTICDFTALPFEDCSFKLAVFDPPHLTWAGKTSWTYLKYGRLEEGWEDMIKNGFEECFRILDPDGVLIFKWSEVQIPLSKILPLFPYYPPILFISMSIFSSLYSISAEYNLAISHSFAKFPPVRAKAKRIMR